MQRMPFNEKLADRVREIISVTHKQIQEKRMFGGLCFMVNDKMCGEWNSSVLWFALIPRTTMKQWKGKELKQWILQGK